MKKVLVGIATVGVVSIGGIFAVSGMDKEKEPETSAAASNETGESNVVEEPIDEEKEEVVEIPTERTVDTGPNPPWKHFKSEKIEELHENGETVYLYSDAIEIEEHAIDIINTEVPEGAPATKGDIAKSTARHLDLFIVEVSDYVDNQAYFDKLGEVSQALKNEQYDSVPTLIEEAKTLRES
ncbi:hypothetical protein SAMN05216232_2002 [Virgibacillus subterraneus]|uniref:Uncharacterized protein n=1 Tax=Virgibacillus subterraneus TaxID=621109 RepID=A0A1H9EFN8_9BACI|nr:hypothetical protein [Virgibacillus subterraneus]SEQ24073.1 hypothetical protein SAMN05216232_2002 [Virgibacillus subterraneus]